MTELDADRSAEMILVPGAWLLGIWRFDREIDDRRNRMRGRVTGEMIFTAEDERIRWHEIGTLSWGDNRTPVTRTLFLTEDAAGWIVTFADGRYFHDWRPGTPVRHPCGADDYTGRIDAGPESLIITWDASGPSKDYTTTTRLNRANRG